METTIAFNWYVQHAQELERYKGKHVAIVGEKIAGIGKTAEQAYKLARKKYPTGRPCLAYIPKGDLLALYKPDS